MSAPIVHCPRCHTAYRLPASVPPYSVFVCARCKARFSKDGLLEDAPPQPAPPQPPEQDMLPLFAPHPRPSSVHRVQAAPKAQQAPVLRTPPSPIPRLFGWLGIVLLALAAAGFFVQRQAWLKQSHLHRALLWAGLVRTPLASDWKLSEELEAYRLRRADGSFVLLIEGRIRNLAPRALVPPRLRVSFFGPFGLLEERRMPITEPPSLEAITKVPWQPPPIDHTPIPPSTTRSFVLVVPHPPDEATRFVLAVLP